jgi:hypothetical protein
MESKRVYKYCILATPKTGTFSVAQWAGDDGEMIGHESHDCHGIVSGFWFTDHSWYPFGHAFDKMNREEEECLAEGSPYTRSNFLYQNVIALAREPIDVINSLFKFIDKTDGWQCRSSNEELVHFEDWYKDIGFDLSGDNLDKAIKVWLQTYEHILKQRVDHFIKLEEFPQRWFEITGNTLRPHVKINQSKKREHVSREDILARMNKEQKTLFANICDKFGYE